MKKVFYILFLLILVGSTSGFVYVNREKYQSFFDSLHPCDKPTTYRIGTVDKRFNLTNDQFVTDVREAANIWNGQQSKNIFAYSASGKVSVNMVFDERQQASNKISSLDSELGKQKDQLESQINAYRSQVADFKKRLSSHNAEVNKWNSQGGAPQDVFDRLNQEQKDLQAEADKLNDLAKKLNLSSEDYNLNVGKLNSEIGDFNADLDNKPEEGIFIGESNKIEIYFNNNHNELVHTIAHEFGHSIGVDHNNNSKSIMYPYSTKVLKLSTDDIDALGEVCRQRTVIEAISVRLHR